MLGYDKSFIIRREGEYIKKIGFTVFVISFLLLIGYGVYHFLAEFFSSPMPVVIRIGITGIILGLVILIIGLIKERMEDIKNEKNDSGEY
ncbi:MAG: hypothetical protein ACOCRZ_06315 [Halothermotrichaceae bacterium]